MRILHQCEIDSLILTKVRAVLCTKLKTTGVPQKSIAKWLDITPAAVSQYLSHKRAKSTDFKFTAKLDDLLDTYARQIFITEKSFHLIAQILPTLDRPEFIKWRK